ncbi:MAG TPA: helix-turn-helix domain-containing protein [Pirellulaceae bacterium]|nr:helix-turn-helix domain-containing protein [Pirellulaceae bacterium]
MAGKFVDLKEASAMIGVSPDDLIAMRSRGDIFGYRDGASWKFKLEEVERVISERRTGGQGGDSKILSADDDEFENMISGLSSKILAEKAQEESESGSVLISEQELGVSSTGQSTIIGKGRKPEEAAGDSDLRLADESGKDPLGTGSDKLLEAPGSKLDLASASDVLHGSDIHVAAGSGTGDMPKPRSGSGTGDMPLKPSSKLDLGDDLSLGDEADLEIGSDSALDEEIKPKSGKGSDKGSGKGSDVTLGAGDSGINLKPSDSGLSLEQEPLDLGGSGVESLELPEDDEVISLESEVADPDQATQLKADNEFLLSPGETLAEDESDSGSQVIALEDSESFDQEAATMLKAEPGGALAADAFQPVGMEGVGAQPVYVQIPKVELPYSIWNVLSLGLVLCLLTVSGMMMMDIMFNMWSFSGTTSVTTGVMDAFLSILNMG